MRTIHALVTLLFSLEVALPVHAFDSPNHETARRRFLLDTTATLTASTSLLNPAQAVESSTTTASRNGLAVRMSKRDPSELRNRIFNIPPSVQVYPEFMRGDWQVTSRFSGYLFPSSKISKPTLMQDFVVPGFQKCSIAATADVGKEQVSYQMRIDPKTGWEDRRSNLQQSIAAYLGYSAVQQVLYEPAKNPNRLSIDFVEYRTVNAERIELFCNARESESYTNTVDGQTTSVFVASEHLKQVTFGTGSTQGVPRQVGTNYGLFWTWKQPEGSPNVLQGNLLVAAYLDPQDALYFQEPTDPVVVYSHVLTAQRI